MKAKDIRFVEGKYKYLFKVPFGYGYSSMLDMAQFIIDHYFLKRVRSFRVSLLAGQAEKEYKFLLSLHGNRISKCKQLQIEQGVIYLKGESSILDDEIEIAWFNQLDIIGVAGNHGDDNHIARIESMLEDIVNYFFQSDEKIES